MNWCTFDLHCCVKNRGGTQKTNENFPCPTTFDRFACHSARNATELGNLSGSAGGVWVTFLNNAALYLVVNYKDFCPSFLKARYDPSSLMRRKLVVLSAINMHQMILWRNLVVQLFEADSRAPWILISSSSTGRAGGIYSMYNACCSSVLVKCGWNQIIKPE